MNKINPIVHSGMLMFINLPDEEHRRIMQRLKAYGITPTGEKSKDIELLREKELELAKIENCVCSKFLTVSKEEQEKIQEKKKEKKIKNNPLYYHESQKGQEILGEQIYQAIKIKKEDNNL